MQRLTFRTIEGEDVLVTLTDTGVGDNDIDATIRTGADGMFKHGYLGVPGGDVAFDEGVAVGALMSNGFL